MNLHIEDLPQAIRDIKRQLRQALPGYAQVFAELETDITRQINELHAAQARGEHPVPQLQADDIVHNRVTEQQKALIRQRGCVVIHGVFPQEKACDWNQQIGDYLEKNHFV